MYEFLDRLCNVVLPRVRDFRGLPQNSFDGRGNYTLGLKEQLVFPEIDYTRVDKIKGMNITMTTSAKNDEQGRELLKGLGFPFREKRGRAINGTHSKNRQVAQETEVQGADTQPLPLLRPRARGYIRKFQMCRICFSRYGAEGRNSRRRESQLVGELCRRIPLPIF